MNRLSGLRILWVENHARFIAVALPVFFGEHDVTVVPSVVEARERIAKDAYDAVIVDYDLDDGKGTEVVGHLLALPDRPLIVAASAHADGNEKLRKAGADVICSKANFKQLAAALTLHRT